MIALFEGVRHLDVQSFLYQVIPKDNRHCHFLDIVIQLY